jgi:hypothetical protein
MDLDDLRAAVTNIPPNIYRRHMERWFLILGAFGSGTALGAIVSHGIEAWAAQRRRAQERAMRDAERAHALELRRLEDAQRLRDQRLRRLEEGLEELVRAAVELQMYVVLLESGGEAVPTERRERTEAARVHAEAAHARLALDPEGERLTRMLRSLIESVQAYESQLLNGGRTARVGTGRELVVAGGAETQRRQVLTQFEEVLTQARETLAGVARTVD